MRNREWRGKGGSGGEGAAGQTLSHWPAGCFPPLLGNAKFKELPESCGNNPTQGPTLDAEGTK